MDLKFKNLFLIQMKDDASFVFTSCHYVQTFEALLY